MKRRLRLLVVLLVLGLITTVTVAWLCAGVVDVSSGPAASVSGGDWTVTTTRVPGALQIVSQRRFASWSPAQATGAPDTPSGGDYASAWAPATSTGQAEWLDVEFERAVVPQAIDVYESYNPGAITRVTLVDDGGNEVDVLPGGQDPAFGRAAIAVSHITVGPTLADGRAVPKVKRVKIYQGRVDVPGWNEVDAVGLIDGAGDKQWAVAARASSWFGQGSAGGTGTPSVPSWSGLQQPGTEWRTVKVGDETRVVEARGWPLVALWADGDAARYAGGGTGGVLIYTTPPSGMGGGTTLSGSSLTVSSGGGTFVVGGTPAGMSKLATVPYRPIWPGLMADTAIFACLWAVVFVVVVLPRKFVRELSRVKRGCCIECGYDLGYDFVRGCPECGWRREGVRG